MMLGRSAFLLFIAGRGKPRVDGTRRPLESGMVIPDKSTQLRPDSTRSRGIGADRCELPSG